MFGKKKPVNVDTTGFTTTVKVTVVFAPSEDKAWRATATAGKRPSTYGRSWVDYWSDAHGDTREEALEKLYAELINYWGEKLFRAIEETQMEFSVNGWKEVTDGV